MGGDLKEGRELQGFRFLGTLLDGRREPMAAAMRFCPRLALRSARLTAPARHQGACALGLPRGGDPQPLPEFPGVGGRQAGGLRTGGADDMGLH